MNTTTTTTHNDAMNEIINSTSTEEFAVDTKSRANEAAKRLRAAGRTVTIDRVEREYQMNGRTRTQRYWLVTHSPAN